ncbi:signal recognition particle SRP9/SRP14 subunit [Amylocystis lapponica]|nr:signal recognition particle SRP9/SRP14 subunit [Amylocystis lapponica]
MPDADLECSSIPLGSMQRVDHDSFLQRLAALFKSSQDVGSIWLTHKRLTHDGEDAEMHPTGDETREYPCLIRATDGGKVNFSTTVDSSELDKFHTAYGTLLKASMVTVLRKRDKKREKQRAEEIARRKRRLAEEIAIEGAKRGNGRHKRQRRMKAASKQEESRKRAQEREEAKSRAKSS